MQLLQTVKVSYEAESYILDGCVCGAAATSIALSLSTRHLRVYDAHTAAFVFDVRDHTRRVSDVLAVASQPHLLFSCQDDGGVMLSDCRHGRAVHFVTDYSGNNNNSNDDAAAVCNSIAVTPSGTTLAVALGGEVAVLDTRMWREVRRLREHHIDDITRLCFCDEAMLCSASEDQMVLFANASDAVADEDDRVVQAINTGEVMTKMACHAAVAATTMVGSCENGLVCAYDMNAANVHVPRASLSTYLVDWCLLGSDTLCLVAGTRDDDGNAGPLSVRLWDVTPTGGAAADAVVVTPAYDDALTTTGAATTTSSSWSMCERVDARATLQPSHTHTELTRVALGLGDRLVTGGEDGVLAFWSCCDALGDCRHGSNNGCGVVADTPSTARPRGATTRSGAASSTSSSSHGAGKARVPAGLPQHTDAVTSSRCRRRGQQQQQQQQGHTSTSQARYKPY